MPDRLAVAEIADRLAVLDHIGDDVELGMLLVERLAVGVRPWRIELAEIPAEGDQLRVGQVLPVKDDDEPLAPGGLDRVDLALRDGLDRSTPAISAPSGASRFLIERVIPLLFFLPAASSPFTFRSRRNAARFDRRPHFLISGVRNCARYPACGVPARPDRRRSA